MDLNYNTSYTSTFPAMMNQNEKGAVDFLTKKTLFMLVAVHQYIKYDCC